MTNEEQIHERILQIQQELESANPNLSRSLFQIHTDIGKSPELLHILSDSEIAIIVKGLSVQSKIQITTSAKKPSSKSKNAAMADLEI